MKKALVIIAVFIMIFGIVSCKKSDNDGKTTTGSDTTGSSQSRAKDSSKGYKIGEGPGADNEDDIRISGDANGKSESETRKTDGN